MIFSRAQLIALGFLIIVLIGSVLLMLAVATKTGESTSLLGAVFTATSATCVTGLIVYDTFTHWTLFGQIIILSMIQIGGLGFILVIALILMWFGKKITFKNSKNSEEIVKMVPLDKILIETDCPYLSPEPFRGKRNDSRNVKYMAQKIADVKGISLEQVAEATYNNAKRIFGIK